MKIKFTKAYTTDENKPRSFTEGQVLELDDTDAGRASAQHFINRGVAVEEDSEHESGRKGKAKESTDANKPDSAKTSAPQGLVPNAPAKG